MDLITPQEYVTECLSLASEADDIARKALQDGEAPEQASEARDEWLRETVDGHQWVIYTYYAQQVLVHSEHDNAYVDDMGPEGVADENGVRWSALAYWALLADITTRLTEPVR